MQVSSAPRSRASSARRSTSSPRARIQSGSTATPSKRQSPARRPSNSLIAVTGDAARISRKEQEHRLRPATDQEEMRRVGRHFHAHRRAAEHQLAFRRGEARGRHAFVARGTRQDRTDPGPPERRFGEDRLAVRPGHRQQSRDHGAGQGHRQGQSTPSRTTGERRQIRQVAAGATRRLRNGSRHPAEFGDAVPMAAEAGNLFRRIGEVRSSRSASRPIRWAMSKASPPTSGFAMKGIPVRPRIAAWR